MIGFLVPRRPLLVAAALALLLPGVARAQTYGADQGTCDRGALSQVFSTSTGNLLGSAGGAVVGGLLGSQFGKGGGNTVLTIAGILGGALAGGYIGRAMDPVDQGCVSRALESTPTNQTIAWNNPDSKSSYWVTPTRTFHDNAGTPCRDYVTNAVIDGRKEHVTGTACRQPDGTWQLENEQGAAAQPVATAVRPADRDAYELGGWSDQQLRDERQRLRERALDIQTREESVEREMDRRGIRR